MSDHDWHRPMEDNPYCDEKLLSLPPMYQWTCSKCGEVVYRDCSKGEPPRNGCADVFLHVLVKPNLCCPPCAHFKPELVDWSLAMDGDCCERANYAIDCEHRKVCRFRNGGKKVGE